MSPYSLVLAASVAALVALFAYVATRLRRRLAALLLSGFLGASGVAGAVGLGYEEHVLNPAWGAVGFAAVSLGYASVVLFVVLFVHEGRGRQRTVFSVAVLVPGLVLAAVGGLFSWSPADTFQPSTDLGHVAVNAYLVLCLGVALAESFIAWRRFPARQPETFPLILGIVSLVIAGPIYGFELVVLGITSYTGANLAAPLAGALFIAAMSVGNPLRFRGRVPEGARRVPWAVAPGAYLIDEPRPKYAEALFLAGAHETPALAIVSDSESSVPDLAGVEMVRLPPGRKCAATMAATSSEFLARNPNGSVLVDDFSYVVANSGLDAAGGALSRAASGVPAEGTLVVSLSKLTNGEREALLRVRAIRLAPPPVESRLTTILQAHVGASTDPLARAALARGKRIEDLTIPDLPHVRDYMLASLADMRSPADDAAQSGWRRVSEGLAADLETLWRTPPTETDLASSPPATLPEGDVPLIRAAEVLGASAIPQPAPEVPAASVALGAAIRDAFLGSLGPAGEAVYRRVLGRLRKDAAALGPDDLPKVSKLADEAVADLFSAIDVEAAKKDLNERTRRLHAQLNGLARGER
ncbi:MAG: hypothetical protein E6K18_04715 [Methanobacteriota archaeon]|nr:MAG: hypothetical protein E6K18_04715 [Euryarchaeota archaeon]